MSGPKGKLGNVTRKVVSNKFLLCEGKGLCIFFLNKQDGNRDTQFHSEIKFIFLLDPIQKLRLPLISVPVDVVLRPQPEASCCTPFSAVLTEEDIA